MANKKGNTSTAAAAAPQAQTAQATKPTTSASSSKGRPAPHSLSLWDRFAVFWLAFTFFVHVLLDGVWFYHNKEIATAGPIPATPTAFLGLFQQAWKHENAFAAIQDTFISLVKSLFKGYALSDKRIATGDDFLSALFGFNLFFVAPLVLLLAYGIAHRRWWRHNLQLTVTALELVGIAFYFLTEHFNGYANVNTKSIKYYNVYFWAANLSFAFPTALLFLQSFFANPHNVSAKGASNRIGFTVKFVLGSTFLGVVFLLASALAHHHLDSKEVEKYLTEALELSSQYANEAYNSASAAAAEAAHQAHVLAAPYVDQAAEFVHQNLGK